MRSLLEHARTRGCRALCALLLGLMLSGPACALAATQQPSEAQVSVALEKLKHDPNLASTRKMKMLRFAAKQQQPQQNDAPAWLQPFIRFFAWLADAVRYIVWVACVLLVGIIVVYLLRVLPKRWQGSTAVTLTAPTHVQDLDIRPESLPDDIGAASRALWERGEHRAALALLYRGCLSRLVHVYGAPVHDSTTEGECIELAARYLSSANAAYVSRLIRLWQRSVYRGEEAPAEVVLPLCDAFRGALDPPPSPTGTEGLPA